MSGHGKFFKSNLGNLDPLHSPRTIKYSRFQKEIIQVFNNVFGLSHATISDQATGQFPVFCRDYIVFETF